MVTIVTDVKTRYAKIRKPILAPGCNSTSSDKHYVETGDVIVYEVGDVGGPSRRLGRVLGKVTHNGRGEKYPAKPVVLAVLQCDEAMTHAAERHVDVDCVVRILDHGRYFTFAKWFLSSKMPDPETVFAACRYGISLNNSLDSFLDEKGNLRRDWREVADRKSSLLKKSAK